VKVDRGTMYVEEVGKRKGVKAKRRKKFMD